MNTRLASLTVAVNVGPTTRILMHHPRSLITTSRAVKGSRKHGRQVPATLEREGGPIRFQIQTLDE